METILKKIKKDGHRLTKVRKAIVEILSTNGCLLSTADISSKLSALHLNADRTTIYRELCFLLEKNIIRKSKLLDNKSYYEICAKHHHHLICTKCGDIKDIVLEKPLDEQEKKICKKYKFKALTHSLEFYGLCDKCK